MRPPTLVLVLVLAAVPSAREQTAEAAAGTAVPVLCARSEECALREGRGSVCDQGRCEPDQDRSDLAGVVFTNFETFASVPVPAGGVGLRFMMNRQSRTSISLDLTVAETTFGLYFGCGEAF